MRPSQVNSHSSPWIISFDSGSNNTGTLSFLEDETPRDTISEALITALTNTLLVEQDPAAIHRQQGDYFYKLDDFETALKHYTVALSKLREKNEKPDKNLMMCLHRQGIVLELLERLPEALDAFEETLQIHRDLYGTNNKLDLASHLQDAGMVLKNLVVLKKHAYGL